MSRIKYYNRKTEKWEYADNGVTGVVDPTLSKGGQAADAKITGIELKDRIKNYGHLPNKILKTDEKGNIVDVDIDQPDWKQEDEAASSYIKNRPLLYGENGSSLRTVASKKESEEYKLGENAVAIGVDTQASGKNSYAEGVGSMASGEESHAEGFRTFAFGQRSHAEGEISIAKEFSSHAEGSGTLASGNASHAEGAGTLASGIGSHAEGHIAVAAGIYSHVQGKFNIPDTDDGTKNGKALNRYAHIVGNGDWHNDRPSNAYTLDWKGNGWHQGSVTSKGADYAEYFEWEDGNPDSEDRVGRVVALNEDKIHYATSSDDILGIVSGTAAVLGDNAECEWNNKYKTDDFGRTIWKLEEEFEERENPETHEKEKISLGKFPHRELNPEFDSSQEYVRRSDRSEWDTIGMFGKIYALDDGTCKLNGYAKVGEAGILTNSEEKTNIRIMKRTKENIVLVLLK